MRRLPLFVLVLAAWPASAQTPEVPPDLANYVAAGDGAFIWKLADTAEVAGGTVYTLDLISQKWQGVVWDHKLQVIVPKGSAPKATMLLWNQGGAPNTTSTLMATEIARRVGSPIAFLFGVPKQPLYDGKKEDALIAETFVRYLDTKDPSWPLLFPMAKSVVRAMDALQTFGKEKLGADVKQFVVTGASKRGWTSWLTAAAGDPRVKAIAPMVIDTLNFAKQMPHQFESFGGKYSEQIRDYEARKLLPAAGDGRRPAAVEDGGPVDLPGQADPAQAAHPRDERPVLGDRRHERLLGRPAGAEAPVLRPERRPRPAAGWPTPNDPRGKKDAVPGEGGQHPGRVRPQPDRRRVHAPVPLDVRGAGGRRAGAGKVDTRTEPKALRFWTATADTRGLPQEPVDGGRRGHAGGHDGGRRPAAGVGVQGRAGRGRVRDRRPAHSR